MKVVRDVLRFKQPLKRQANCIQIAIYALPENADSAHRPTKTRRRSSQRLREAPILLDEDECREVRHEQGKVGFSEDISTAGLEPLRLEDVCWR